MTLRLHNGLGLAILLDTRLVILLLQVAVVEALVYLEYQTAAVVVQVGF
jgi:hypothetical protein